MEELKLLKREEHKAPVMFRVYQSIFDRLTEICDVEDIMMSHLLRHLVNKFLAEYDASKQENK